MCVGSLGCRMCGDLTAATPLPRSLQDAPAAAAAGRFAGASPRDAKSLLHPLPREEREEKQLPFALVLPFIESSRPPSNRLPRPSWERVKPGFGGACTSPAERLSDAAGSASCKDRGRGGERSPNTASPKTPHPPLRTATAQSANPQARHARCGCVSNQPPATPPTRTCV